MFVVAAEVEQVPPVAILPFAAAAILGILAGELFQAVVDASVLAGPVATVEYPFQEVGFVLVAFVQAAVADCSQPSKASTAGYLVAMWSPAVVEAVASHRVAGAC